MAKQNRLIHHSQCLEFIQPELILWPRFSFYFSSVCPWVCISAAKRIRSEFLPVILGL